MSHESDETRQRPARILELHPGGNPEIEPDVDPDDPEIDPDTALITSYLLGELTAEDRAALRERMRRDPDFREDVMIMTSLMPSSEALEDLKEFDERLDSSDAIMLELERRRATRIAWRKASRRRARWVWAASIASIAVLPPAGVITARVASLHRGGQPATQAVASSTPRRAGSSTPADAGNRVYGATGASTHITANTAISANAAGSDTAAMKTRGSRPVQAAARESPTPLPPERDELHGAPTVPVFAASGPAPISAEVRAPAVACDTTGSTRALAQAAPDSAARPPREDQGMSWGSLVGTLMAGARAKTTAAATIARPTGVGNPVVQLPAGTARDGGSRKVADSTASGTTKACVPAGNTTDTRRNP